ncbi:hypothetical protein [Sphingomonas sp. Leaf37]|uniref:hypothetical protein n=1 Tax=Sphingomonas sp. Leaf37 TaxID=2876552 RepID=UPI001E5825A1|nr:hypothetical protein [Sphingomonas sp. Leaf37]
MMRARVLAGDSDELIGDFEFDEVPRPGEEITVPGTGDDGVRIFVVREVCHVAAGATIGDYGTGPCTVLRYCEEIH